MDEMEFVKKYHFDHLKMVTVVNPRAEDYIFGATIEAGIDIATGKLRSEQRTYRVKAGERERLPGPMANMYLDQMAKLIAQDEDKFRFLIDFALKAQYYDDLIIDVIDIIDTYQPLPQYLQKSEEEIKEAKEVPFAEKDGVKKRVGRPAKV